MVPARDDGDPKQQRWRGLGRLEAHFESLLMEFTEELVQG